MEDPYVQWHEYLWYPWNINKVFENVILAETLPVWTGGDRDRIKGGKSVRLLRCHKEETDCSEIRADWMFPKASMGGQSTETQRIIPRPWNLMKFVLLHLKLAWEERVYFFHFLHVGMEMSIPCLSHRCIWETINLFLSFTHGEVFWPRIAHTQGFIYILFW